MAISAKSTSAAWLGSAADLVMAWIGRFGMAVAPPVARVALALPFFRSGLTRWDGFLSISPGPT